MTKLMNNNEENNLIKINKHFFHGFYSNNGYSFINPFYFTYDYPIQRKRAIFGSKVVDEQSEEESSKPIEFENEESAFQWYKKTKLGNENFNKLNFPDDFCKNYFLFTEQDFYKYRNYFHDMMKSILLKWNFSIDYEGNYEQLNTCECSSSSSSSLNASLNILDFFNVLNDLEIEVENIFDTESINGQDLSFIQDEEKDCCFCPPCDIEESERDKYNCNTTFKAKCSFDIDFDSEKILEIEELEKRIGALAVQRNFSPVFNDEEDQIQDTLRARRIPIYEKNWELKESWQKDVFGNTEFFPFNATDINDPILRTNFSNTFLVSIDMDDNPQLTTGSIKDNIENQKQKKETENLGKFSVELDVDNAYFVTALINFVLRFDMVVYIKSEKKFMCFLEIFSTIKDRCSFVIKRYEDQEDSFEPLQNAFQLNPLTFFSTSEIDKIDQKDEKHIVCPNGVDFSGIKLKKEKFNFKIDNEEVEIELFLPEEKEYTYEESENQIKFLNCPDYTKGIQTCRKVFYKKKWELNMPTLELKGWKNEDFSDQNNFPPKIVFEEE